MAPSFLGISSALRSIGWRSVPKHRSAVLSGRQACPAWLTPTLLRQRDEKPGRAPKGPYRSHTRAPGFNHGEPSRWAGDECTRPAAPTRTAGVYDTWRAAAIPDGAGPGG